MPETSRNDSFIPGQLSLFDDEDVTGGERRKRYKLLDGDRAKGNSAPSRKLRLLNDGSLLEISGSPERETR